MKSPFPILTPEEAAAFIQNDDIIGFSGFTPAGAAKVIPTAIADRAMAEHEAGRALKVGVITGASTGPSLDGALAKADAIKFRTPFQSDKDLLRKGNFSEIRNPFFIAAVGEELVSNKRLDMVVNTNLTSILSCR